MDNCARASVFFKCETGGEGRGVPKELATAKTSIVEETVKTVLEGEIRMGENTVLRWRYTTKHLFSLPWVLQRMW